MDKSKLIFTFIVFSNILIAQTNPRSTYVKPYTRSDGQNVNGYYRTLPNQTNTDNYSTKGNINPYTGKEGTINPDNSQVNNSTPESNIFSNSNNATIPGFNAENFWKNFEISGKPYYRTLYSTPYYDSNGGRHNELILGYIPKNTILRTTSSDSDRSYVIYNGVEVRISSLAVEFYSSSTDYSPNTDNVTNNSSQRTERYFAVTGCSLRANNSTKSEIITKIPANQDLEIIKTSGDWYKVKFETNEDIFVGWTHKSNVNIIRD